MSLQRLILPVALAVGAESTRGMTTQEHFQDLGETIKQSYKQRIESGDSNVSAAIKASGDGVLYDATITGLKWLRAGVDFVEKLSGSGHQPVTELCRYDCYFNASNGLAKYQATAVDPNCR